MRSGSRPAAPPDELILRELHHRANNDLQLIVALLAMQSRRAPNAEAREALEDATARVTVLAGARAALNQARQPNLRAALDQVAEALHSQAEPRGIAISVQGDDDIRGLPASHGQVVALAVNELTTNAIKHAFAEGKGGCIRIRARSHGGREAVIEVDDDGIGFPPGGGGRDGGLGLGLGLGLVRRLIASIDGLLIGPIEGSKRFEIRVPLANL